MKSVPFLRGPRVDLRGLTEADCRGAYREWLNDAEVCRYNGHHVFPYGMAEALDYVRSARKSTTDLVLAVVRRRDRRHVGNIALQNIDWVHRTAELAVLLGDKSVWGKGYAREAARLLVAHGFGAMNLHRVGCGTSSENGAMQRLAVALGMKREGRRRRALFKGGRYHDVLEYGILRDEFSAEDSGRA